MMEFLTTRKIKYLLQEEGIDIKKRLGQHFLTDRNARNKLLSFAGFEKTDTVVEIGPGLGALTDGYIETVKQVYAFEVDHSFCRILKQRFAEFRNFQLYERDFLETDKTWWEDFPGKVKVISNTPYYLSGPIVMHLLKFYKKVELALVTVQKEVGEKITGKPGNKNYGAVSVLMALYTDAKICYFLKRATFFPSPEVDSVAVRIIPFEEPKISIENEKKFFEFLPLIFSHRRKKLPNVVNKIFKVSKAELRKDLEKENISPDCRVEELQPEEIYKIYRVLHYLE
jgi:16S rRNA (adenine1518-N6/adenine1519-N6)-dimethyltransferase